MADQKKSQIPSWQQQSSPEADTTTVHTALDTPTTVHESGGSPQTAEVQSELAPLSARFSVEDIKRFLLDPGVRDAPEEKKISFLEAKGVDRELIDSLLKEVASEHFSPQGQTLNASEFKDQLAAGVDEKVAKVAVAPAPPRDTPPVVTYPEFLVKPQKPPPLVTIDRLLTTAYAAGSLAILFYGASEYLIKPMTATLAAARHEFAAHAQEQVTELNGRLEKVVSTIPASKPVAHETATGTGKQEEDVDSIHSDPTEVFHRDIGVQTSPLLSRRSSTDSSAPSVNKESAVEKQSDKLESLRTNLNQLLETETNGENSNTTLEASVSAVRTYLNTLVYSPPYTTDYGTWNADTSSVQRKDTNDAIAALRNEIRGVKGVLLSAKRFPGPTRVGA